MNLNYIDSSKAREKFFEILREVFEENKVYVIKKDGKPMARISCVDEPKNDLLRFAGILSDKEAKKMKNLVNSGRKDGSSKKKYLLK